MGLSLSKSSLQKWTLIGVVVVAVACAIAIYWACTHGIGTRKTVAAAAANIPQADFWLGQNQDWVVVVAITMLAICIAVILRAVGPEIVAIAASILIVLPIFEEFLFRYGLTGCLAVEWGWIRPIGEYVCSVFHCQERDPWVEAMVLIGLLFGFLHMLMLIPWRFLLSIVTGKSGADPTAGADEILRCPPGLQVCEGLFLGMFNGSMFITFFFQYHLGLLITMIYVWLVHIVVNFGMVAWNIVVNLLLGGSILAHVAPRFILAVTAVFWFVWCWVNNSLAPHVFR